MTEESSKAARELARLGAAKGGRARASVLTPEERREIARTASRARWQKAGKETEQPELVGSGEPTLTPANDRPETPSAISSGTLALGAATIEVHVLNDGRRVIAQDELARVLHGTQAAPTRIARDLERVSGRDPTRSEERRIEFRLPNLPSAVSGYEAELLIEICNSYLQARGEGTLKKRQRAQAATAETIVRACATVGITALVDQATGYQRVRADHALQNELRAFIAQELQSWARVFPEEFWRELARLEGTRYTPRRRPLRWGDYALRFVFAATYPGLGTKLRELDANPGSARNRSRCGPRVWSRTARP